MALNHQHSNVESPVSMVKAKFGDVVRPRTDVDMTNQVLCKLVAHNICWLILSQVELRIEPVFENMRESIVESKMRSCWNLSRSKRSINSIREASDSQTDMDQERDDYAEPDLRPPWWKSPAFIVCAVAASILGLVSLTHLVIVCRSVAP